MERIKRKERDPEIHSNPTNDAAQEEQCEECGGNVTKDADEKRTCEDCGLIYKESVIDRGPEWRSFNGNGDKKSRVGSPITRQRHDKGLTTTIGNDTKDANGNLISGQKRAQVNRLKKWNKRASADAKERGVRTGLTEIKRIGSSLGLSETVHETAAMIFRQACQRDLLLGRAIETVAAASVYIASRRCDMPRTPEEFYPVCQTAEHLTEEEKQNRFNRTYKYLIRELNLGVSPADPAKYINRFVDNLPIENSERLNQKAKEVISTAGPGIRSGTAPSSISAAAIYAASLIIGERVTQKEIAEATNTTEVTIRQYYGDLIKDYQNTTSD